MENFRFKIKNKEIEIEFQLDKVQEDDMQFIDTLLSMAGIKTETPYKQNHKEELEDEDCLAKAQKGYNLLSNNIEGFHEGTNEYIAALEPIDTIKNNENKESKGENLKSPTLNKNFDSTTRVAADNTNLYQTYYICPYCKNRGKRFIPKNIRTTTCHSCHHRMKVSPATLEGFPNQDQFGNYFIAGDFKPEYEDEKKE